MFTVVQADEVLKLAGVFQDNMVLQRETDAPIWGWASVGEVVSVKGSWNNEELRSKTDKEGKWMVRLRTPKAGGPYEVKITGGGKEIILENVLFGEVWICGGQSNMQWKMRGFGPKQFAEDVKQAKFPEIRFCSIPQAMALEAQSDVKANWGVCSPKTVLNFSAVGYFFGARLYQELNVPIGLISSNWGGSSAEAWMSAGRLKESFPEFGDKLGSYAEMGERSGVVFKSRSSGHKGLNQTSPAVLYNSMIEPLAPYAIKGVVWYQGETNVKNPVQYRTLFPAVIEDWRARWGIGEFPFYYVQIAPFAYKREKYPAALLREAQLMSLAVPKTGMVVTMDVGEVDNIHPREKKPVGERLARLALARDYGKLSLVDSGPIFDKVEVVSGRMKLSFKSVGGGLMTNDGKALSHFTIAGKDRKFYPAEAFFDGDSVIVQSRNVENPKAVRFGWGNADITNFVNKEGLAASSFRTDDWPTNGRK